MQDLQVVDNFFDDLDFILQQANKQNYFTAEQLSYDTGTQNSWPGIRTDNLHKNVTLADYILNIIVKKFTFNINPKKANICFHKRFDTDNAKDWVHKDASEYALIVYLSKTNLESGTAFYTEDKNKMMTINFVQNRALFFKGKISHTSMLNYGKDDDCRLTLNGFFWL